MTEFSSADFCKLSLQEVIDFIIDHDADGVRLMGTVDDRVCNVYVKLELMCDE